jgi:hypothetical protein
MIPKGDPNVESTQPDQQPRRSDRHRQTDFYGTYHANTFRTIEACEDWRTERLNDAPTARLICQPRYAWYRLVWAEYQRRMKQRQTAGAAR